MPSRRIDDETVGVTEDEISYSREELEAIEENIIANKVQLQQRIALYDAELAELQSQLNLLPPREEEE